MSIQSLQTQQLTRGNPSSSCPWALENVTLTRALVPIDTISIQLTTQASPVTYIIEPALIT